MSQVYFTFTQICVHPPQIQNKHIGSRASAWHCTLINPNHTQLTSKHSTEHEHRSIKTGSDILCAIIIGPFLLGADILL
jgi:hypothetical protein